MKDSSGGESGGGVGGCVCVEWPFYIKCDLCPMHVKISQMRKTLFCERPHPFLPRAYSTAMPVLSESSGLTLIGYQMCSPRTMIILEMLWGFNQTLSKYRQSPVKSPDIKTFTVYTRV